MYFWLSATIGCKSKEESYVVNTRSITESVYASGTINAVGQYEVFSINTGLVQKIHVQEGDIVKKGQILFTLQDATPRLQEENARLAAVYAESNKNGERLNEISNNIKLAQLKLINDSTLYERQKELWARGIGSKNDLEQRSLAYESSLSNLKALHSRFRELKKELDYLSTQSKQQLSISRQIRKDYAIVSKIHGKVYKINAEVGELATPARSLALIGDDRTFEIELQIDEKDIVKLQAGQKAVVRMDAYGDQVFDAVIEKIHPTMDEKSRSFTAIAQFLNAPLRLYPFLTAEANVLYREKTNALVIPRNYLIRDSLVNKGNNRLVKIATGIKDYKMVEITAGLKTGDVIYKPTE
ncbi:MAG TPA: efflux RND transporter periplasmic adaptor subunit [Saprospiraceae bacterium]|nr:efflux RND transporter periplasmic adaptor subunit [Saprospiraceae bacterium]HRG65525.1 efflux RND transporter periplasmic adaptor subunit [Saprospiraceae bacterium]